MIQNLQDQKVQCDSTSYGQQSLVDSISNSTKVNFFDVTKGDNKSDKNAFFQINKQKDKDIQESISIAKAFLHHIQKDITNVKAIDKQIRDICLIEQSLKKSFTLALEDQLKKKFLSMGIISQVQNDPQNDLHQLDQSEKNRVRQTFKLENQSRSNTIDQSTPTTQFNKGKIKQDGVVTGGQNIDQNRSIGTSSLALRQVSKMDYSQLRKKLNKKLHILRVTDKYIKRRIIFLHNYWLQKGQLQHLIQRPLLNQLALDPIQEQLEYMGPNLDQDDKIPSQRPKNNEAEIQSPKSPSHQPGSPQQQDQYKNYQTFVTENRSTNLKFKSKSLQQHSSLKNKFQNMAAVAYDNYLDVNDLEESPATVTLADASPSQEKKSNKEYDQSQKSGQFHYDDSSVQKGIQKLEKNIALAQLLQTTSESKDESQQQQPLSNQLQQKLNLSTPEVPIVNQKMSDSPQQCNECHDSLSPTRQIQSFEDQLSSNNSSVQSALQNAENLGLDDEVLLNNRIDDSIGNGLVDNTNSTISHFGQLASKINQKHQAEGMASRT